MKIVITASGPDMDSQVDPRFGRCEYFIFIDSETSEFEAIANASGQAMGGAGIQAAQAVANTGAEGVVTGNVGPNAFQTLAAAGIRIFTGAQGGSVKDALEKFKKGELQEAGGASVGSHAGMGGGGGGMGGGRGMGGGGGGRGMGGGGRMRY